MKRFLLVLTLLFCLRISTQAQEPSGSLEKEVTLSDETDLATSLGEDLAKVTTLKVSGKLTEDDFKTMKDRMIMLQVLDMSGVTELPNSSFPYGEPGNFITTSCIPELAFQNKLTLKKVIFPASVGLICQYAFDGCNNIEELDFSKAINLKSLNYNSFSNCSSLKELDLSTCSELLQIYFDAFKGCSNLRSLNIAECKNLTYIGKAFDNCASLQSINLSNCSALATIEEETFMNAYELESVILEGCTALTNIGNRAFKRCHLSGDISLPSSIQQIGEEAFCDCNNITTFNFSNCVNLAAISNNAFASCSNLKKIDFTNCSSLNTINTGAFNDCPALESVEINNSFFKSKNGILFKDNEETLLLYPSGKTEENFTIPSTVKTIGEQAIPYNEHLNEITIPETVLAIKPNAFGKDYGWVHQEKVILQSPIPIGLSESIGLNFAIIYVPKGSAEEYRNAAIWKDIRRIVETDADPISISLEKAGTLEETLANSNIPQNTIQNLTITGPMNESDFKVCQRMDILQKIDLSKALLENQKIPSNAFYRSSIGYDRFTSLLESVIFPDDLKTIEWDAFKNCPIKGSLTFPREISHISSFDIAQPSEIILKNTNIVSVNNSFDSTDKNTCTIKVPKGIKAKYQTDSYWGTFNNIEEFGLLITVTSSNEDYGEVTGGGGYEEGENAILTASTKGSSWYESNKFINLFDGWYDRDVKVSDKATYNYTVSTDNKDFIGKFFQIKFESNNLSWIQKVKEDTKSITVRMELPENITDAWGWFENDQCISNEKELTIEAGSEDRTIYLQRINTDYYGEITITDANKVDGLDINLENGQMTVEGEKTWNLNSFTITDHAFSNTSLLTNSPITAKGIKLQRYMSDYDWQFISLPYDLRLSEIMQSNGYKNSQFVVRRYDGQSRATNGIGDSWKQLGESDVLNANQGYIIRSNYGCTYSFNVSSGMEALFNRESVTIPLNSYTSDSPLDANWNLVGNPYPCFYNIAQLFEDGLDATVTVWSPELNNYEYYTADDEGAYLSPLNAFFVQKNTSNLVFNPEGRVAKIPENQTRSQNTTLRSTNERIVINLILSNGVQSDRTRIVFNESASEDYELGKDAAKFRSLDSNVSTLYTLDKKGNPLAINERPLADGVVRLGLSIASKGYYTLSLRDKNLADLILIDRETGATCNLSETSYHFEANTGELINRFELRSNNRNENGNTTSIGNLSEKFNLKAANGRILLDGCPIHSTLTITDVLGRIHYNRKTTEEVIEITLPQPGIYYLTLVTPNGQRIVRPIKR